MVVEPPAIGGLQPWIMGREFLGVASQEILAEVARLQYLSAAVGMSPVEQRRSSAESLLQLPGKLREAVVIGQRVRSEEHTSELQSLMRISYAVFCLKKKILTMNR